MYRKILKKRIRRYLSISTFIRIGLTVWLLSIVFKHAHFSVGLSLVLLFTGREAWVFIYRLLEPTFKKMVVWDLSEEEDDDDDH